jgi:hypothetical protein
MGRRIPVVIDGRKQMLTGKPNDEERGTSTNQDHFKSSFKNGQFNQTFVNNFRIIGQGPGNNFLLHETFHLTVNANGELTTIHDNFSVDCK